MAQRGPRITDEKSWEIGLMQGSLDVLRLLEALTGTKEEQEAFFKEMQNYDNPDNIDARLRDLTTER